MQTGGKTGMPMLTVAFSNAVNTPKTFLSELFKCTWIKTAMSTTSELANQCGFERYIVEKISITDESFCIIITPIFFLSLLITNPPL